MKLNGIELTKEEELKLNRKEAKELRDRIGEVDYRIGASLRDSLRDSLIFVNTTIFRLKNEIKLKKLQEKQLGVRNNRAFDSIQKQIDNIKDILK